MLIIDDRIGSKELLPYFRPYDVAVELGRLEFGDAYWYGNGVDGPVLVGVERKRIGDLVSSMRSGRLSGHQLPGLLETFGWIYLVVEGSVRCGDRGVAEIHTGRRQWTPLSQGGRPVTFREIDHYLATLEHVCGLTVKHTFDEAQTVAWLVSRYKWWTDKEWDRHQSHIEIYAPYEEQGRGRRGSLTRRTVGLVEKVCAQLPGVDKAAWAVAKRFRSVAGLLVATVEELAETRIGGDGIGGKKVRRLGEKRARVIWEELRRG